jgi:hypothetical protein
LGCLQLVISTEELSFVFKRGVLDLLLVKSIVILHDLELTLVGILDPLELRTLIPSPISEHLDLLLVALLL